MVYRRFQTAWLLAVLTLLSFPAIAGSYRTIEVAEDATVLFPPNDSDAPQPALILLPYTGGTSADLFHWYYAGSYGKRDDAQPALVLLDRKGRKGDYSDGEDWAETVEEYEEEIGEVIQDLVENHGIDRERIAVGGFSMGGDMAWALALRRPEWFKGAVIMGARCNWRDAAGLRRLQDSGTRVAFFIGDRELPVRARGLHAAHDLLNKAGVMVRYDEMPDRGHLPAPAKSFWQTVSWLFEEAVDDTAACPKAEASQSCL